MMEAAPASSFEMGQAEFAFQFLAVALDAPAQFGRVDEHVDGNVFGQGRKPVFRGFFPAFRPFDDKPFERMGRRTFSVARGWPYPHGGEARGQDFIRALQPRHDAPSVLGKSLRQLLGGNRGMFAIAPDARWRATLSAPGFGRQRFRAGGPDAERRLHAHRIGQPDGRHAGAERAVDPVASLAQHDPARDAGRKRGLDLIERDLGFGLEDQTLAAIRLALVMETRWSSREWMTRAGQVDETSEAGFVKRGTQSGEALSGARGGAAV
jgi:hypothetical protein